MIVKAWGSWALFQSLLTVLRQIGDRHDGVSIANVATRWVLDQSSVGAVIIGLSCYYLRGCCNSDADAGVSTGTRMGITDHTEDNQKVLRLKLNDVDRADIEAVLDRSNGRLLITNIGDCGAEYR